MEKVKLYAYVDETGQDTKGKFFLVVVILLEQSKLSNLETVLEGIEKKVRKGKTKWKSTPISVKKEYLQEIVKIGDLKQKLFYAVYANTIQYTYLTAMSIAKSVREVVTDDYFVSVIIDGLTDKEKEKIRKVLKEMDIKYKTIRGMKDEQNVFLRLADAMAGFLRDYLEGDTYTKAFFAELERRKFIKEV